MGQAIFWGSTYLLYYLVGFALMPYHAWRKSKSIILTCVQIVIAVGWASMIAWYVNDIPENEHGAVIVGLLFTIPIFCLISQLICLGIYLGINLITTHFRELWEIKNGM